MLDALNQLNQRGFERFGDPEIQTRIAQYEMAFRMQSSVPDLVDLSQEPQHILDLYGPAAKTPGTFSHSALLARRLVERGVRVVQILHRGWDQHGNLPVALKNQCEDTEQATAALVMDLKQRGLAGQHPGRVGRRVRPHGLLAGHADQGRLRPRPSPAQLLHVAGRRRHQRRASSTARPTTSATTSSRTR